MSTQSDPPRSAFADTNGPEPTNGVQERAHEVADHAQDQAQAAASQARDRVRDQVDQRAAQAGEQLNGQASDLRSVSQALREQGKDGPAQTVDRVAGYAEKAGGYLQAQDADSLLRDAEDFGRQKPAAVAASALAIGFVAARFLKASSRHRYVARETPGTPRAQASLAATVATPSELPSSIDSLAQPGV